MKQLDGLTNYLEKFNSIPTPFYFYDVELLIKTLKEVKIWSNKYHFHIHYALKANVNDRILTEIKNLDFGADCVSGNEIKKAIQTNFASDKIAFAGVGKTDLEILYALDQNIFCFNVESIPELEIINQLAEQKNKIAPIAIRINPNVNANTHKYITTGLEENKFGLNHWELNEVCEKIKSLKNIQFLGLHFHVGSQIMDLSVFKNLCTRINEFQQFFIERNFQLPILNVGGGLGIDYQNPDEKSIPNFELYFSVFDKFIEKIPNQKIHFELGRSLVGQCGSLISRIIYIKKGLKTNFAILDAGMTELLRPALYQAYHKIENLSSKKAENFIYDVVGPICESSDCFGKSVILPESKRNDLIAIRSAGAYGEVMSSRYNLRDETISYYSEDLIKIK